VENLRRKGFVLPEKSQQEMFSPDVFVGQAFGLFSGIGQYPLAFLAERQLDGSRHLFPDGNVAFHLLSNGFNGSVGTQEPVGQGLIFAQQTEQQVFGFDIRAPELAGLISGEENDTPGFFCVSLEHSSSVLPWTLLLTSYYAKKQVVS
jgi:hypothetical protein